MTLLLQTDYVSVYNAWCRFRKAKKPSFALDEFLYNLEANIYELSGQLSSGSYKHGPYSPAVIYEKKRRDLAVASIRDRVVHRLVYDYLVKIYDKSFDPDVWSSRASKGLHACLKRTQDLLRKYPNTYIWRADIARFYDSVSHLTLRKCLARKLSYDERAINLLNKIIDSYSTIRQTDRQTEVYLLAI